ncbi:endochitinase [Luteimicrobium album]|uniref:Endochitinase n=1 Tax=Luteimicrobium album TaxID=1054550 RepID=A0ABQ6HYC2_9MICO|nr:glycoside hydrolase family 9 protein [Luteimicrobium album]GMA23500.1 endochitinase [Luteimicrobium album]
MTTGPGQAVVLELSDHRAPARVVLRHLASGAGTEGRAELWCGPPERVVGWRRGPFARVDLPPLEPGDHVVEVDGCPVLAFRAEPDRLQRQVLSDVLAYFRAMRSTGEIDRKDRVALRWGDESGLTVDARGGWLDASGDTSKFLSHLTYTRTMSPQQIPLCAWAMFAAHDVLATTHPALLRSVGARLRDEGLWGADFLVRFRAPEGYFYTGIFDALTKDLRERVVTAPLQDSVRTSRYQAAYRHGGGLAIAALARASRLDDDGDLPRSRYLDAAVAGFVHLEQHNREYLFDGEESVVDDYTALLAAAELVGAGVDAAEPAARARAAALVARYVRPEDGPGWFVGDAEGRPFFHAVEPGLPILALLRFAELLPDRPEAGPARATAVRAMLDVLVRTGGVANPFGYPRQRTQPVGGAVRDAFFFPHANETGYWWQGENAGIASFAAAASAVARSGVSDDDAARLDAFAHDQLAWVLGRNPFDACMLHGKGRNNPEYASDFPNFPGGIANGVTSGHADEEDVALLPPDAPEGDRWRWAEQWIPHTGWFLLAVASAR